MMLQQAIFLLFPCLWVSSVYGDGAYDEMSNHYVLPRDLAGVTNVVLAADVVTTEGPFFEVEADYINTTNLTADAYAGSPGVTTDRTTVVDAIPITLTLGFYNVSNSSGVIGPLTGAEIFIWHADAIGTYSSVDSQMQTEVTTGQFWLRATQITDVSGVVVFKTILPGWYQGRAVHWHIRVKLPGAASYVATTQLFMTDAFVKAYSTISPYTEDTNALTSLADDTVYPTVSSDVAPELVLNLTGSSTTGYSASLNFGIDSSLNISSASSSPGGPPGGPGGAPPNGTFPLPPNGTNPFPPNGTNPFGPPPNGTNPIPPSIAPTTTAPTSTPSVFPTPRPIAPTNKPTAPVGPQKKKRKNNGFEPQNKGPKFPSGKRGLGFRFGRNA
jgi:protocatechuate 3,4-dioxygenase beta subunit